METVTKFLGKTLAFLAIIVFAALILGLPLMWLWNWLMPEILGLKEITFLQAIGLIFMCSILFKNSSNSKNE